MPHDVCDCCAFDGLHRPLVPSTSRFDTTGNRVVAHATRRTNGTIHEGIEVAALYFNVCDGRCHRKPALQHVSFVGPTATRRTIPEFVAVATQLA